MKKFTVQKDSLSEAVSPIKAAEKHALDTVAKHGHDHPKVGVAMRKLNKLYNKRIDGYLYGKKKPKLQKEEVEPVVEEANKKYLVLHSHKGGRLGSFEMGSPDAEKAKKMFHLSHMQTDVSGTEHHTILGFQKSQKKKMDQVVKEETEPLNEIRLGIGDHRVIKSFMNKKPLNGKKLSTDGKSLSGNWLGGSGIAHHSEKGIHLNDVGSKSGQQIHHAIKKHNSYDSHSDVPHYELHEGVITNKLEETAHSK